MKILFIGDMHLRITRFDLATQFLKWITATIQDIRPDIVVNLGDTLDTHSVVRSEILAIFIEHLDFVKTLEIPYYHLLGNHEFNKPNDNRYHALLSLKNRDLYTVVDKRIDIDNLTLLPHYPDHKKFPLDTREICIAHQTFVGADYGYIRPEVGVLAEDVAANLIISGHVHLRQEFGKVIYPGSPYSQSISDIDQVKGVLLFDTNTYEKKFLECPLPMWRKLTYEIGPDINIDTIHSDILIKTNNKHHWTACITGPKVEVLSYVESNNLTLLRKTVDITIKPTFSDSEKKLTKIKASSMEKIMQEYVDNVYNGSIDKNTLKAKVVEIIEQVNNL